MGQVARPAGTLAPWQPRAATRAAAPLPRSGSSCASAGCGSNPRRPASAAPADSAARPTLGCGARRSRSSRTSRSAYYTFIERGRDVRPSKEVLRSIGRALNLTAGEQRQLQDLRTGDPPRHHSILTEIGEEVHELVDVLDPNPTYTMNARWDLMHWNRAAELLFTNWHRRPPEEQNMLWFYLCDPYARRLYVDWEAEAAQPGRALPRVVLAVRPRPLVHGLARGDLHDQPRRPALGGNATTAHRTAVVSSEFGSPTTVRWGCVSSSSRSPTTRRSRS